MTNPSFSSSFAAENAFYSAIEHVDLDAMMAVWEDSETVTCIHPLGPRLLGRSQIQRSWRQIFHSGTRLQFQLEGIHRVQHGDLAVHVVYENITVLGNEEQPAQPIIATNIYHLTPQGWRMIVHHASPGPAQGESKRRSSERLH
jgi:ketosteroid isomerase-like protein